MEKLKRLALLFILAAPCSGFASNCNPTDVSGCPTTFSGSQGSTTPTAITGTGYTTGGVTTASIDTMWGIEYNHSVCPYNAGGSDCTVQVFMPHECAGVACADHEKVFCMHGGGGSAGSSYSGDCFANVGSGCCQSSILYVQRLLGTPNAVGGKGIVLIVIDYRLTTPSGGLGVATFPAQWQDAKCSVWHVIAGGSTFPGSNSTIGFYGPSWGGTMVFWAALTSDTAYTSSCDSSAPGTDPKYRVVAAWPALDWLCAPGGGTGCTYGNGSYDNTGAAGGGTQAYINAVKSQMNSATEATIQSNCSATGSYGCDPFQNIASGNAAVLANAQVLYQFGSITSYNACTSGDCLIMVCWGLSGCTGAAAGAAGGNLVNTEAQYIAQTTLRPFMQILTYPGGCIHECDTTHAGTAISPSQVDAFNFLMGTAQPMGGNIGGTQ
jgi:hypothetical protein